MLKIFYFRIDFDIYSNYSEHCSSLSISNGVPWYGKLVVFDLLTKLSSNDVVLYI